MSVLKTLGVMAIGLSLNMIWMFVTWLLEVRS